MSKLFTLSDYLDLNERFLLVYVMRVCMGRRVRRDYCSHYFNSQSLTLLTSLQISQLCIHCHGDFLPHFFSITKEKPKWKMFAALLLTFLLPWWQPTVWMCLAPGKICTGQSLIDGWSHCPACTSWVGAGPETTDNCVSGDSDLKEDGEISFEISLFHNLNLRALDKIFMDTLDIAPPTPSQSFQMKGCMGWLCMLIRLSSFSLSLNKSLFSLSVYALLPGFPSV